MSIYHRLETMNIALTPPPEPVAAFVPFVQSGSLIFVSGHIARRDGKPWVGRLGDTIGTAEGKDAARSVAVELLGTLHAATGGDLARVKRITKITVLVNSTATFNEQHLVANGASELLLDVFGKAGAHARSAFGVAQIPFGSCLEIELTAEV